MVMIYILETANQTAIYKVERRKWEGRARKSGDKLSNEVQNPTISST